MDMPTSTIELTIKCQGLADKDLTSKSDPVCVMFQQSTTSTQNSGNRQQGDNWFEVGRTEVIRDTLDPEWTRKFVLNYNFEQRQMVKFEVYDWDAESPKLDIHDFLGQCEISLGQIVNAGRFVSVLKGGSKSSGAAKGKIFITAEELQSSKEHVTFQFSAEKLDKKDFFGKSDPVMVISKGSSLGGHWSVVHKTEVVMCNLNPVWQPFSISVTKLCNGNYDRKLKFDVYDWNSDGSHDFIGSFATCLAELKDSQTPAAFKVINEKKKAKKGAKYKDSGTVFLKKIEVITKPTFLDYLQSGTSMNFSVAVDFTASNGNPSRPESLHYLNPMTMENQYTTAIRSVGEIIQDYDSDRQFPALGFGARLPPAYDRTSHEFFLNLRPDTPFCQGVDGLLAAYRTSLQSVQLYGPTNFSPVIRHVANFAKAFQSDGRQYFVLLILTDGIITDMEATISAIVSASSLPMSIIIVGVGNEDFSAMEELDGDDRALRSGGVKASRDIVQFVELRKFLNGPTSWNKEALAREVLAEVPDQLVKWMLSRSIRPENVSRAAAAAATPKS